MTVEPLTVTAAAAASNVWMIRTPVHGVPEQILMSFPVTAITVSLNPKTRLVLIATLVALSAGVVGVIVGAVSSRVIVVVAVAADDGPVFVAESVAPFAANRGVTVPSLQPLTVTVRVDPESVPGLNVHPVAVPVFEKSPDATPVTDSEKVNVKVNDVDAVGVDCDEANDDTEGEVLSRVIVVAAVAADVGPLLFAESLAPLAANCGVTVPDPQLETVIV